jgi:hypothetical protein
MTVRLPLLPLRLLTLTLYSQKLIRRTVFPEHLAMLHQRQDALLVDLAAQAEAGFSKAEEEWEKSVVAWGTSPFSLHRRRYRR